MVITDKKIWRGGIYSIRMKRILFAVLVLGAPMLASAHAKWLVPEYQSVIDAQHGAYQHYTLMSTPMLVWAAFSIVAVLMARFLHHHVPQPKALVRFANIHRVGIDRTAQCILGVFLIATALLWNVVILPAEVVTLPVLVTLKYVQIVIGAMFILHFMPRYASIGLIALTAVVTIAHGVEAVLENVILFALAFYFYLMHTKTHGVWAVLKTYSIDIVRIGTGVSLVVLAFTEKLLYPELSMQFLVEHHWNFMQLFFPWFSNELFVFSTGMAEMLFGIIFIFGYVTRITTLVVATFFVISVTTMFYQAQVWEVEDFVVYCAAVLLLAFEHNNTTLPDLVRKMIGKEVNG